MDRLTRQVEERARDDFGEVKNEVARNWAQLILNLFSKEIARSASSYAGEVEQGAAGSVRPMVLDGAMMLKALDDVKVPDATRDFLKGCLMAAVDETDPFGNELVGQVATSCVLHSIAAGRGRVGAQRAMGSLEGERAVLDTPLLVSLLGPDSTRKRLETLVTQAVELGMEVVVPVHVLEELEDLVARVGDEHLKQLINALGKGVKARAYAKIVSEQVLELFLDAYEAKEVKSWNDFRLRQRELRSKLEKLGVVVREHGNKDRAGVALIDQFLSEEVSARGSSRGAKAISRDAESIEMVWRARRRAKKVKRKLWPGGWMISNDRHSGPAYRRANRTDLEPLVLTPAQLAALLVEVAPAAEIPDLVSAAASFLRQESMLRIATKYPPAIALTLARSLSSENSSSTDERIAQLPSLGEMLEHVASGETLTGERLAAELAAKRTNRLAAAGREQVGLASLERDRLDAAITRSTTVISEETARREAAEKRALELEANEILSRRRLILAVLVTAILGAIGVLAVLGPWWIAVGTVVTEVVVIMIGRHWIASPEARFGSVTFAAIPEVLAIVLDLVSRISAIN
jgi:hypothetical protein